jgi:flagellar capping protein FliD
MGTIQFTGIQSGIDVNSVVSQLVALRQKPVQQMQQAREGLIFNRSVVQDVNSQFMRLNTMLFNLTMESTFRTRTATSSAADIVGATAGIGAATGSHSVGVSQLARASRAVSGLDGALFSKSIYLSPSNTMGIQNIGVTGTFQTTGATAQTKLKDTLQAGQGSAAPTAGDTITISGNLKDGTAVNGTFTFAGDSTDTLGRLAQKIVETFQGEVTSSIGARGEIILTEANPAVAGDITYNTLLSPFGLAYHDNDFSGSTFVFAAGNSKAGGGAVARQLTNLTAYSVSGNPAVGTDALASLDQVTGTMDTGDIIRITGANPNGTQINGGTGTFDFVYGTTGTTISDLITAVNGTYTGATLALESGRLVLTDDAGGTSLTTISLSFVDGAPSTTSFAAGSFGVSREGAAQTSQVITTGPFMVEALGTYLMSGSQGRAGRVYGSVTLSDASNSLGSYGVSVFNQFAIDPDGTGPQGYALIQGLSATSSLQDLVNAINAQLPTVTAQLVPSATTYRLEIQSNTGGRDIRVIDGIGGIIDTLIKAGATDLASSANDGANTFSATSASADFTMAAVQRLADGSTINTAATGADGDTVTRLIRGASITGAAYGNGSAVAINGNYDTLNTSPASHTFLFGNSDIAASPATASPPINIFAPLSTAGFASIPRNASASPGFHSDGVLVINGVSINIGDVNSTSMAQVMAQINTSGAGVTMSYDGSLNRFIIENNSEGPGDITLNGLGNTSNLFTILGLTDAAGGASYSGQLDSKVNKELPLSDSGISLTPTSGVFTINGVAIYVDVGVDTLDDVISAINRSRAGVTASYDEGSDRMVLMQDLSKNPSAARITVGAATDTSNFLSAVRMLPYLGSTAQIGSERKDAILTVDGVEYTRSTNSVTDIVSGTTLELKGITSSPVTLSITADTNRIRKNITDFIVEYNTTLDMVSQTPLTNTERKEMTPLTDESAANMTVDDINAYNGQRNELLKRDFISRDPSIKSLARQLREMGSGLVTNEGKFRSLADIGLASSATGSSAEDARQNKGLLIAPTTDRDTLETLIDSNATLISEIANSPDDLYQLFAAKVESTLNVRGTHDMSSGLTLTGNVNFTITDGSGSMAQVNFNAGMYTASQVLNTISSALVMGGIGSNVIPYFDSNYRLNFTTTSTSRSAEIALSDRSSGADSLTSALGITPGTFLGPDPIEHGGVAQRTRSYIQTQTRVSGSIYERIKSGGAFDLQIQNYDSEIELANERIQTYETRLRNQFVRLDTYIAQMNDVSQYVTAFLAAQTGTSSSSSSSSS